MAGSHEVRGSIPLGSTTDTRGARQRRRAPLFCFRAHRTERAYRTKSVSHSGASARAGAPFSFARTRRPHSSARAQTRVLVAHGHREAGALARARPAREEAAPDLFGRIEAIQDRAGTHSALGRLGPAEFEGADWPKGGSRPKAAQKPSTESGRIRIRRRRAREPRHRRPAGGARCPEAPLPQGRPVRRRRHRARQQDPEEGARPSAGVRRPRPAPPRARPMRPAARRRLIYEMVGMPAISLSASLGRLPKQRPKLANRGERPAPLPMRRKKRRERRSFYLVNP